MFLVVGLGNPGAEYADNRHNLGFMVVDELARARARRGAARRSSARRSPRATIGGERVLLCKPMEFMNVSGQAVARVAGFWKVPVAATVVVHDELDVPFGAPQAGRRRRARAATTACARSSPTSGDAGIRCAFASASAGRRRAATRADYVLADFSRAEAEGAARSGGAAADAVEAIVTDGLAAAMNRFNGSAKDEATDNSEDRP